MSNMLPPKSTTPVIALPIILHTSGDNGASHSWMRPEVTWDGKDIFTHNCVLCGAFYNTAKWSAPCPVRLKALQEAEAQQRSGHPLQRQGSTHNPNGEVQCSSPTNSGPPLTPPSNS